MEVFTHIQDLAIQHIIPQFVVQQSNTVTVNVGVSSQVNYNVTC